MEHNVYAPPAAIVADIADPAVAASGDFYVVGRTKFLLLFVVTFGLYQVVWMYQHWATFKARRKIPMWPVMRAIFPIFFAHSLTEEIGQNLQRAGIRHAWSPRALATGFVLLNIFINFADRFLEPALGTMAYALTFGMLAPLAFCVWSIQRAANIACADPEGGANARLTLLNYVWIVLGTLWWLLVLIGLTLPAEA